MIYVLPNGRRIGRGVEFSLAGVIYPANWLERASPDELVALGITTEEPQPDPPPPPPTVDQLLVHAAYRRWTAETGGLDLPGFGRILTDERTRGVLTAAWSKATANPAYQINDWKTPTPGVYATLTAAQIVAIADAVEAHVQACFTKNREVDEAIVAGTITTFAAIDAAGWPGATGG